MSLWNQTKAKSQRSNAPSSETYYISETVRAESALPVRTFTDLWEADKFLDKLISDPVI